MKAVSVLTSFVLTICSGMSISSSDRDNPQQGSHNLAKQGNENAADEFVVSLMPLKILLEYQLGMHEKGEKESHLKGKTQGDLTEANLKSLPASPQRGNANELCNDIDLMKNLQLSDKNLRDSNPLTDDQLEKIYNSLKGCFLMRARNSKLWGPLWHCLNRLFLFFVFG